MQSLMNLVELSLLSRFNLYGLSYQLAILADHS